MEHAARRVFALSDVHTDFADNLAWVRALHKSRYQRDVLVLAGDVSDKIEVLRETLKELCARFHAVFFVPGNHDLWVGQECPDSIAKHAAVLAVAAQAGARTSFARIDDMLVVPLQSWYHAPAGRGLGEFDPSKLAAWQDFYRCVWPAEVCGAGVAVPGQSFDGAAHLGRAASVSRWMLARNDDAIATCRELVALSPPRKVITVSHFLPRTDLNPVKLAWDELHLVSCCEGLDAQLRSLGSTLHVFGHTHIPTNKVVDGVTYRQAPLGYPGEPWIKSRKLEQVA